MLQAIDDAILSAVTSLVLGLHRRMGMDRHATIRELLTGGIVCVVAAAGAAALAMPIACVPLVLGLLFLERRFPERWREADSRSKASSTPEGWRSDMELASIHMRLRTEYGRRFLILDIGLAAFYATHAALWAYGGSPHAAAVAGLFLARSVLETAARYALMVPPPPPGSGGRARAVGAAVPDAA